ncbi:MAG: NAD(P)H-binding protein [Oscillospiraceae bacterium]|nr:NAD(P)H-binding protein [Oscillospiraceae bacterium]
MKVVLAGAFGNLGSYILKKLVAEGHEVVAAGRSEKPVEGTEGKYTFVKIDATSPQTLSGICDGADVVISTLGLTTAAVNCDSYDVDYKGNLNLYLEAKRAGVKKFNYISVIACDHPDAKKVPMLNAKYLMEQELKTGDMDYVIYRPTGYFYDIVKVFRPFVEKGEMQLLKGYGKVRANVVDCPDFAAFIVDHMCDTNAEYDVGGRETYTYDEMAKLCFEAAGKPLKIKYQPKWLFNVLANLPKIKKEGRHDVILFGQFTLSHDLVGKDVTGDASFAEYLKQCFGKGE